MTDSMTDVREVIENVLYLETEMERYECAAKADAILSALSSHGLKVLGREPTQEMWGAAEHESMSAELLYDNNDEATCRDAHKFPTARIWHGVVMWRAMWDAAE